MAMFPLASARPAAHDPRAARSHARRCLGASLFVAWLVLAAPAAAAPPYLVEHDGRSTEIPTRVLARREVVSLETCARFFGLELSRERKQLRLHGEPGSISLQIGRSAIQINGQPLLLSSEVDVEDGRFLVPLDFLTRAMPRYLDVEVRHDPRARTIRFDPKGGAVACERFEDRFRLTIELGSSGRSPEVSSDGSRRIVTLPGVRLPEKTGGCPFDDVLSDLQVGAADDGTRLTLFTGPRFGGMELREVPAERRLVIDVLDLAALPDRTPLTTEIPGRVGVRNVFDLVVIDPGHGGDDRGAVGPGGLVEKDVTLGMALELAAALRARGLRVELTRSADVAVPLALRTESANRQQADLFLSLHANAAPASLAWGAETYFLHLDATDEAARSLAASENDATGLRAAGMAASGDLEMLLWDMAQQQYLEESSRLADTVQRELNDLLGTRDRGVKQANFLVLRGATMPAILVEVGFLSNPKEEARLRDPAFRARAAEAIARAVMAFRAARSAREGR